ncbi:hypothetical protein ABK040_015346 [Willaertia magna]
MTSRLDRLLNLLDSGSPAVRSAAAKQVGEVTKYHTTEVPSVLNKVSTLLRAKSWETRSASAEAINAIATGVPEFNAAKTKKEELDEERQKRFDEKVQEEIQNQAEKFRFKTFNFYQVLAKGKPLYGSNLVADEEQQLKSLKPKDKYNFYKRQLLAKLGFIDESEHEALLIYDKEHLDKQQKQLQEKNLALAEDNIGLSAKDRRNKFMQKQKSKKQSNGNNQQDEDDGDNEITAVESESKKTKTIVTEQPQTENKIVIESAVDTNELTLEYDRWPFHFLAEKLLVDLFNSSWEIRHGAAIGLREILKVPEQAKSAGKSIYTIEDLNVVNERWLEDCSIRVLCLFALDRFTDFLSDQVVAPIPETCAQILGIILKYLSSDIVKNIVTILIALMHPTQEWKVRHSSLLGLKYAVALRYDVVGELLNIVLPAIIQSLADEGSSGGIATDDVRAVAADCLVPIAEHVMKLGEKPLQHIFGVLWNSLSNMDDLSSATASIMTLLAKLYSIADDTNHVFFSSNLHLLVPRLYPYLRHNIVTVRFSALDTLHELIKGTKHFDSNSWLLQGRALYHIVTLIFQNIIVDTKDTIVEKSIGVWQSIVEKIPENNLAPVINYYIGSWCSLISTPLNQNMDISLMTFPEQIYSTLSESSYMSIDHSHTGKRKLDGSSSSLDDSEKQTFSLRFHVTDFEEFIVYRTAAAKALAIFAISTSREESLSGLYTSIDLLLRSTWSIHKETAGLIIQQLYLVANEKGVKYTLPDPLYQAVITIIQSGGTYSASELQSNWNNIVNESNFLLQFYSQLGMDVSSYYSVTPEGVTSLNLSIPLAQDLIGRIYDSYVQYLTNSNPQYIPELESLMNRVKTAIDAYLNTFASVRGRAFTILACAVVFSGVISSKPVLQSLMVILLTSIEKNGSSVSLQKTSCIALANMLKICREFTPCPNSAIIKKVMELLCRTMPKIYGHKALEKETNTTEQEEEEIEKEPTTSTDKPKRGRKKKTNVKEDELNELKDAMTQIDHSTEDPVQIGQRGAVLTLREVAAIFKDDLFNHIEPLRNQTIDVLLKKTDSQPVTEDKLIINALHILRTIIPSISSGLFGLLQEILRSIINNYISNPNVEIRKHAALTVAEICYYMMEPALITVVLELLPRLADPQNVITRRGAALSIYTIINKLEIKALPAVAFLAVPLLKRMSDQDDVSREISSNCFGLVIRLLPLEKTATPLTGLEKEREEQHKFIDQLLDNSKVAPFEIPIKVNAELRQYQKDGVSWLAFLNKYNLHGILCDDMGLGKTLQTIIMVASDIQIRKAVYEKTKSIEYVHLPSLVVCPPTLLGHWHYEIKKFCPYLTALQYIGPVAQRRMYRGEFPTYDIVIMSYDVLRNDIKEIVAAQANWNYCVLDEGHIIKNKKTQITKAVKQVKANHRLLLTGTPIQNNVIELWSLFDFLMPGFLGTEKEFNAKYSKPIQASRDAKANSKEQAAGTLALQSLHRQVLPFLLRRVKEDVLHDLPEKIIQDYYCELSPIQAKLYEHFAKKEISKVSQELKQKEGEQKTKDLSENSHVFKALKYLRKLCNHPCLVLNPEHPMYTTISQEIKKQGYEVNDVHLSPKLLALKQLLNDCGIGLQNEGNSAVEVGGANQHRVLIFCQLKQMLDIIQNELFAKYMSNVTFLRLDGDVETMKRHEIVQQFNGDPTIDVLLLTTKIGGLGLNLTGADTVIFVEHDWNPSADLQAMDRAHRIGQKKVVNVYRLITKNTLEEKIMGLQKFKLNISKSVINKENSSLATMDTDQLVDLFNFSGEGSTSSTQIEKTKKSGLGQVMEAMDEYDQEQQYQDFNLNNFVNSVNK